MAEGTSRVAIHARRYAPFYVFGLFVAAAVIFTPTTDEDRAPTAVGAFGTPSNGGAAPPSADGGVSDAGAGDIGASGAAAGSSPSATGGGGGPTASPGGAAGGSVAGVQAATGTTRGGFECAPGVRQLPWSQYAAPCVAEFTGDNGGQTWNGISEDKIRIVVRDYAVGAGGASAVVAAAGIDREENQRRQAALIQYFNKTYELYGRQVEVVPFTSNANPFEEANGRGREQACADATRIAEELDAFAVIPADGLGYGPFSECGAASGLFQPIGAYGFPQEFYDRLHPYVWGVQMSCTRIGALYVEYIAKRIAPHPVAFASDPLYQGKPRRLGVIRPDMEHYFPCIKASDAELARRGIEIVSTFDYVLDPATLPEQMNRAAVQFKADGVTSLLISADFLTLVNLTKAAANQRWGPEWVLSGSGLSDSYSFARLYDQSVVDGHMLGMSQGGDAEATFAADSEMVRTYREATGEELTPPETGNYFNLIHIFNQLQAAGPNLTPETAAQGTLSMPPSGASPLAGIWNFALLANGEPGFQHTANTDAREVFWDGSAPGPDGEPGSFVATLGGRRFSVGTWPDGQPSRT